MLVMMQSALATPQCHNTKQLKKTTAASEKKKTKKQKQQRHHNQHQKQHYPPQSTKQLKFKEVVALWKNPFKFPWICLSTLRHLLSFGWSKRVQLQGFVEPTNGGQKYVHNRNSDKTIFFCVLLECREGRRRVALQSASRRAVGHTKTD